MDPRVDRQIESRAHTYGDLAHQIGLPASEVLALAERAEEEFDSLAPCVLAELAARGDHAAFALLANPDTHLQTAMRMADYLRDRPAWAAQFLPFAVVQRLAEHCEAEDDLDYDVEVHAPFWQHFDRRLPAVADAFARNAALAATEDVGRTVLEDPVSAPTSVLLDSLEGTPSAIVTAELLNRRTQADRALLAWRVEHDESMPRRHAAARALGVMQDLRLIELAEAMFRRDDDFADPARTLPPADRQRRTALLAYVVSLPGAVTLPLARRWWQEGGFLRSAAGRVLELHAEASDRNWLEDYVRRTIERDSGWELIFEVDALVRIADPRSLPVYLSVAERATYAWARTRALTGIAQHANAEGAQTALTEALWDCEAEARELGCRHAGQGSPEVALRLAALTTDALEDEDVREAAVRATTT